MSNKKALIYLGIVIVLIVGLMYFLFGTGSRHNWQVHYNGKSKDPYGTQLIRALLQDYFPDHELVSIRGDLDRHLNVEKKSGNYVFLGEAFWLDSTQSNALLQFVARGNNVFVATPSFQPGLLDSIRGSACGRIVYPEEEYAFEEEAYEDEIYLDSVYEEEEMEVYDENLIYYEELWQPLEDTSARLNLLHPGLRDERGYEYTFTQRFGPELYIWEYLPSIFLCPEQTVLTSLGTINDSLTNFVRAAYGEGHIYLHTTPLAFTNYFLDQSRGLEYAGKVFSHLPPGTIYWDNTNRGVEYPNNRRDRRGFGESPLKYILSQPSLAWAWYILLGMAVFYLIFKAKRRQRIIPVLEKNENTSLEFINTIGRLHFTQSNHRQLALQKMRLFLGFVRDRYHISTKEWDEETTKLLTTKSEIPEEVIQKIFTVHGNIQRSNFSSENTLIEFHRTMEYFYLNCK